jgi:modulator of FtsH protease HflK
MAEFEPQAPQDADIGVGAPDAAQRSLSDALRVSFALLRLLLIALIAIFLLSGMFKVKTGEVAVRLQLGNVVEHNGQDTFYAPGGPYFAWPEPIDTVIRVPVTPRTFAVSREFWFKVKEEDQSKPLDDLAPSKDLDPDQDGFLLTADHSIMHGRWSVTWQVNEHQAADFIRTVSASSTPREMTAEAEDLLRRVAEQALVATVAEHTADEMYLGSISWDAARNRMQTALQRMESGILITNISMTEFTAPLAVRKAFMTVDQAQSARTQAIISAETERARVLGEAAGEAYPVAVAAVEYYERLLRRKETERAAQMEKALGRFFEGAKADECFKSLVEAESDAATRKQLAQLVLPLRVSGRAYDTVEKARGTATSAIQAVRKESETFTSRLQQYKENPRVIRDRLWQETMNELFAGDAERFYLPPGGKEVYLELNRDPAIKKRKEREMYEEQQKKAREKK